MYKEIFKDIEGYEGLYQISNFGNVKSNRNGKYFKEKILKDRFNDRGYKTVYLFKDGKGSNRRTHRLVAEAFICNGFNKPDVNHINGIKSDNNVNNLEWVTKSENSCHAYKSGLMKNNTIVNSKKVIDTQKNIIYNSIKDAAKFYGIGRCHLSCILNGKFKNKTSLKLL